MAELAGAYWLLDVVGSYQPRLRDVPFRDEYAHFFRPWRAGDYSAVRFARDAIERTGPDGWLLADSTTGPTTAYAWLTYRGLPGQRIYSERSCLNLPDLPDLPDLSNLCDLIMCPDGTVCNPDTFTCDPE